MFNFARFCSVGKRYLDDAHRQGGPALGVARLLEQPLVRDHVLRPLGVHIQRVPAQTDVARTTDSISTVCTQPGIGTGVKTKIAIGTFSSSLSLVLFLLPTGAEERGSALAVADGGQHGGGRRRYGSGGRVLSCRG